MANQKGNQTIEPLQTLSDAGQAALQKAPFPRAITPMMAKLSHKIFSGSEWIFERKLDGERCVAFRQGDQVMLKSRNQKSLIDTYPEIADALHHQSQTCFVVDGEIVTFEGKTTSFEKLQQRMQVSNRREAQQSHITVYYYIFDLIYLDGWDMTQVSLGDRKSILKQIIEFRDPLRYRSHRNRDGEAYYQEACDKGWEGLIAKRVHSPYKQTRSSDWQKFKCTNRQEFVIGGYTDPKGERIGFGAILIGYYQDNDFHYAGKVGTGFDDDTLNRLSQQFREMEQSQAPFAEGAIAETDVHWLSPTLVAQVEFTEWTKEGKLRHPRFLGLRQDKVAHEVTLEEIAP
jgi:DNA ligase D-like protein (predicted ligase)